MSSTTKPKRLAKARSGGRMFDGMTLPEWDADALYALYVTSCERPLTTTEDDALCRYLAVLVFMRFVQKRWAKTLPEIGIDPDDVAAECVERAHRKIATRALALRNDGPKVLLGALGTLIWRVVAGRARVPIERKREGRAIDLESHVWNHYAAIPGSPVGIDAHFPAPAHVKVAGVLDALLTPEATARAIRGTAGPRGEGARAISILWRLLVRNLARDGCLWPHEWLPRAVRNRTSATAHALLAGRLQDAVADRAAMVAA